MSPRLDGPGTPEDVWLGSAELAAVPIRDPAGVRPPGRIVVVAPHPDDEVLGIGGSLALWVAQGSEVLVVAVTDGEGSHPGSPTLTPQDLAVRRDAERRRALAALGLGARAEVVRLGLPDGAVAGTRSRSGSPTSSRPPTRCSSRWPATGIPTTTPPRWAVPRPPPPPAPRAGSTRCGSGTGHGRARCRSKARAACS